MQLPPSAEGIKTLFADTGLDTLEATLWTKRMLTVPQLKPLVLQARKWRELFSVFDRDVHSSIDCTAAQWVGCAGGRSDICRGAAIHYFEIVWMATNTVAAHTAVNSQRRQPDV